jgi:hypothetical protein
VTTSSLSSRIPETGQIPGPRLELRNSASSVEASRVHIQLLPLKLPKQKADLAVKAFLDDMLCLVIRYAPFSEGKFTEKMLDDILSQVK